MKTIEELKAIKEEVEALNKKLAELTEEELKQVTGGALIEDDIKPKGDVNIESSNSYDLRTDGESREIHSKL